MLKENVIETDVLVIGGGMAGLFAAIKAREAGASATLVDKNYVSRSGASCFVDGDYAVFNPEWGHDLEAWKNFISLRGEYLNNPEWTEIALKDSLGRYRDLLSWGVNPITNETGEVRVTVSGRSPKGARISSVNLHHGWEYLPAVRHQALKTGVNILDRVMITDLIKQDAGVVGAVGFSTGSGDFYVFKAKATVLSAGGGNFKVTERIPKVAHMSFDGDAMAYRAGAEISNMEFALNCNWGHFVKEWKENERVSLEGKEIHTIVSDYPRTAFFFSPMNVVGSVVDAEGYGSAREIRDDGLLAVHEGKGPLLKDYDGVTAEQWEMANKKFSTDMGRFQKVGLDPRRVTGLWTGMSPWEYAIGQSFGGGAGISSAGIDGRTSLPGLYAAGDTYHSTAIGAMYPCGGTGTRNASVTGARAGQAAAEHARQVRFAKSDDKQIAVLKSNAYAPLDRNGGFDTIWTTQQIKNNTYPYYILLIQQADRLKAALTNVEFLHNHIAPKIYARNFHELRLAHETKNRILAAEMMLRSSLFRKESRGKHYREDYPYRRDPDWLVWSRLKNDHGEMKLSRNPMPRKWWAAKLASMPYRERYPNQFKGEEFEAAKTQNAND